MTSTALRQDTDMSEHATDKPGKPPERRNTSEVVYTRLLEDLLSGRLAPGTPLREAHIAARMASSRAPVREACRRLEASGLVRSRHNRGFVVRDFTAVDVVNIFDTRAALELAAVRRACPQVSDEQIAHLLAMCDALDHAPPGAQITSPPRHLIALHREICALSQNDVLIGHFDLLSNAIIILVNWVGLIYENLTEVAQRNRVVIMAIASRDADAACRALQEYLTETQNRTLQHLTYLERQKGRSRK